MPDLPPDDVTQLLGRARDGDPAAASRLFDCLYGELRARAHRIASHADGTIQPTALVHEAWLKLVPDRARAFEDRNHFLRVAAAAMRSVLVDHVRERNTQKRGGGFLQIELDKLGGLYEERAIDLLALDDALARLATVDERLTKIVELRFFAGLEMTEIAAALDTSLSTIERGWRMARAWLHAELTER